MIGEFFLLGTILLRWEDPSTLLRTLSDDSIEARERAAADLYRRGEELRGFLTDAREAAAAPEVRERLGGILRRLDADERIRGFGGGNRVAGFGASLRSDRFFGSGPFLLRLEIMNLGASDQELPGVATWEQQFPDQQLCRDGAEARIEVKRFIGAHGLRRTTWTHGGRAAAALHLLRPGERAIFEFKLDAGSLTAGDYDITVEYFARDLIPGAEENLRTNVVRVMVRK